MIDWNLDSSWTLFLDRDGVINERIPEGYVKSIEEFIFLPNVPIAVEKLSKIFGKVFVVTNQQGIAKNLMTESNLLEIHDYMCREFEKVGGKVDKCYYAPGLVSKKNSLRKPNPGMALMAQRQFENIDFKKSVMVGDSNSDILFGKNLGMKTVRIRTYEPIIVDADITVESLYDFTKLINK
jgi:histidinol-phosphate phosphatase family protein